MHNVEVSLLTNSNLMSNTSVADSPLPVRQPPGAVSSFAPSSNASDDWPFSIGKGVVSKCKCNVNV